MVSGYVGVVGGFGRIGGLVVELGGLVLECDRFVVGRLADPVAFDAGGPIGFFGSSQIRANGSGAPGSCGSPEGARFHLHVALGL